MRRLAALTALAGFVLAACGGGSGAPRAERARPASAASDATTTTTLPIPTTVVESPSTTEAPAPAAGSDSSSGGNVSSPAYGNSFAPGEPHPNPPGPPPYPPPPAPAPPPYPGPPQPPPPSPDPPPKPPCCKGPDPVRWESYAVSDDGRTLTFTYWSGVDECSRFDHTDVRETSSQVTVTIWERDVTNGNPCVAMAQQKHATAVLQAPLGSRAVVDGAA